MTRAEVAKLLLRLKDVHQGMPVAARTVDAWHRLLEGYDAEDVEVQADKHLRTSQFWPKPAEVVPSSETLAEREVRGWERAADPDCSMCEGVGWTAGHWHSKRQCDCTKRERPAEVVDISTRKVG